VVAIAKPAVCAAHLLLKKLLPIIYMPPLVCPERGALGTRFILCFLPDFGREKGGPARSWDEIREGVEENMSQGLKPKSLVRLNVRDKSRTYLSSKSKNA
jgi:hypothetical protein